MTAVIEECFGSLFAGMNLRQRGGCGMRFTEMSTESALAIVQCDHDNSPLSATITVQLRFAGWPL